MRELHYGSELLVSKSATFRSFAPTTVTLSKPSWYVVAWHSLSERWLLPTLPSSAPWNVRPVYAHKWEWQLVFEWEDPRFACERP